MSYKILISGRLIGGKISDGISFFSYNIVSHLKEVIPSIDIFVAYDRKPEAIPQGVNPIIINLPTKNLFTLIPWLNFLVFKKIKEYSIDIFFALDGFCIARKNILQVAFVHDVNFLRKKNWIRYDHRFLYNYYYTYALKFAKAIICPSSFVKAEILSLIGDSWPIYVVPEGYTFLPCNSKSEEIGDYFVFPGDIHPRKNIAKIIKAIYLVKDLLKSINLKIIITGRAFYCDEDTRRMLNKAKKDGIVHFVGKLEREEYIRLIIQSKGILYCSYYEGYGIPPLEAINLGVPVIVSDIEPLSSWKSVFDEKTLSLFIWINPLDIYSIMDGILKALEIKKRILEGNYDYMSYKRSALKISEVLIDLLHL